MPSLPMTGLGRHENHARHQRTGALAPWALKKPAWSPCWQGRRCWKQLATLPSVIAFEGNLLGGTEFESFDQQTGRLLKGQKRKARLLGA